MSEDVRVARAARIAALVASVWFLLAASWELFGPFGAGHVASSTAIGIAADNMLRWGILAPVTEYSQSAPPVASYYCHHPWGIFWVTTIFYEIFGHRDFVCRLAPVLWSAATPPLLYGIGRIVWGPVAGAVAAVAFTVLPISLAFANFNALEVPVIFGTLLMTWGYLKLTQGGWHWRWLAVSLTGLVFATNADWPAFVFTATILGFLAVRAVFLRRYFGSLDLERFMKWWLLAAALCALVGLGYVFLFSGLSKLTDLLFSGELRSTGSEQSLRAVLSARKDWIYLSFTSLGIVLGVVGAVVALLRLVLRREHEIFPLAMLVTAIVQYVVFKQGADIHIFWSQYFAAYFALACGSLASTLDGAGAWLLSRMERARVEKVRGAALSTKVRPIIRYGALGVLVLLLLSILPDGVRGLAYARRTGDRFDERGYLIHQDLDKTALFKQLGTETASKRGVVVDPSMKYSWSLSWALGKPVIQGGLPDPSRPTSFSFVGDSRFLRAQTLNSIAAAFSVRAVGPFWVVERGARPGLLKGFRFERREPGFFEWYFLQGTDPMFQIVPDAFKTWELRTHFGQNPNPPPHGPGKNLEELRVLHNLAVERGDAASAGAIYQQLESKLRRNMQRELPGGAKLLGLTFEEGVAPLLTLYFLAKGPTKHDAGFMIQSVVEAPAFASWVPRPERERAVGMPFGMPSSLWRPGFIYTSVTEIRKRPGRERFYGYFRRNAITSGPTAPSPVTATVELLDLR